MATIVSIDSTCNFKNGHYCYGFCLGYQVFEKKSSRISVSFYLIRSGTHGLKYPVQIHKSYTIRFNSTLGNAPTELEIKAKYGLER